MCFHGLGNVWALHPRTSLLTPSGTAVLLVFLEAIFSPFCEEYIERSTTSLYFPTPRMHCGREVQMPSTCPWLGGVTITFLLWGQLPWEGISCRGFLQGHLMAVACNMSYSQEWQTCIHLLGSGFPKMGHIYQQLLLTVTLPYLII